VQHEECQGRKPPHHTSLFVLLRVTAAGASEQEVVTDPTGYKFEINRTATPAGEPFAQVGHGAGLGPTFSSPSTCGLRGGKGAFKASAETLPHSPWQGMVTGVWVQSRHCPGQAQAPLLSLHLARTCASCSRRLVLAPGD